MEAFRRDVRDDFQQLVIRLDQLVPREVYSADRATWELRIERLERQAEDDRKAAEEDRKTARAAEEANRQSIKNARYTVVTTVVAGVILAFVGMWLKTGGH